MAEPISDEEFARTLNQMGIATFEQIEAATLIQAKSSIGGVTCSLAETLVQQGVVTQVIRENVEKKARANQQGGIKQLGPYTILKKLGEGGMGAVYLADDTAAGRKVALKVLPQKFSADQSFLSRFRREAKATGSLNHVNIVTAYTTGEDMGAHYYAMEYCEGDPLDAILKQEKVLAWDKAIEITTQVARGLKHAHEYQLIHRDIKPANIFITKDGVAKILDLGLSKNIGDSEQSFNTQSGVALGTPHYISPEQTRGEKTIDGRTDIYSLGATLYHLVTGQTPFDGSNAAMIMMKHLSSQLTNPQDINEDLPDGIVSVIQRMMAKEPADRYPDCGALLRDLELVIDGKTPEAHTISEGKSSVAMRLKKTAPRRSAARTVPQNQPRKAAPAAKRPTEAAAESADPHPKKKPFNLMLLVGGGVAAVLVLVAVLTFGGKKKDEGPKVAEKSPPARRAVTAPETAKAEAKPLEPMTNDTPPNADVGKRVAQAAPAPNELVLDIGGGVKMEMVRVKAGTFKMGSDTGGADEKPAHEVTITKDYYIGKFSVTVGQFKRFVEDSGYKTDAEAGTGSSGFEKKGGITLLNKKYGFAEGFTWRNPIPGYTQKDDEPVVMVSWNDAKKFGEWLKKLTGAETRLPSEAEWEYAARGPRAPDYPWGNEWKGSISNHADNMLKNSGLAEDSRKYSDHTNDGYVFTNPVGKLENSSWCGAFDMAGNVLQWCEDYYGAKYYFKNENNNPQGPSEDDLSIDKMRDKASRVVRGGSWSSFADECRSSCRTSRPPYVRSASRGFRLVVETGKGTFTRSNDPAAIEAEKMRGAATVEKAVVPALSAPNDLVLDLGGGVKMEFVKIPAGTFLMGSPETEPERKSNEKQHRVTISKDFYMGKYHVTVRQFREFVRAENYLTDAERGTPDYNDGSKGAFIHQIGKNDGFNSSGNWLNPGFPQDEDEPVACVSWNDAKKFVDWLKRKCGRNVQLPTEARWEYACRAGTTTPYNNGATISTDQGNYSSNFKYTDLTGKPRGKTTRVGSFKANTFGLYDMHGNVWQWCQDFYTEHYENLKEIDPADNSQAHLRMLRGGSWASPLGECRSAYRRNSTPGRRGGDIGFRCVVAVEPGDTGMR